MGAVAPLGMWLWLYGYGRGFNSHQSHMNKQERRLDAQTQRGLCKLTDAIWSRGNADRVIYEERSLVLEEGRSKCSRDKEMKEEKNAGGEEGINELICRTRRVSAIELRKKS